MSWSDICTSNTTRSTNSTADLPGLLYPHGKQHALLLIWHFHKTKKNKIINNKNYLFCCGHCRDFFFPRQTTRFNLLIWHLHISKQQDWQTLTFRQRTCQGVSSTTANNTLDFWYDICTKQNNMINKNCLFDSGHCRASFPRGQHASICWSGVFT